MPMFYFDIVDVDDAFKSDTVGVELADVDEARIEARLCIASMAPDAINHGSSELRVVVRDAEGKRIAVRRAFFESDDSEG
jgi:hypothetical protein